MVPAFALCLFFHDFVPRRRRCELTLQGKRDHDMIDPNVYFIHSKVYQDDKDVFSDPMYLRRGGGGGYMRSLYLQTRTSSVGQWRRERRQHAVDLGVEEECTQKKAKGED